MGDEPVNVTTATCRVGQQLVYRFTHTGNTWEILQLRDYNPQRCKYN